METRPEGVDEQLGDALHALWRAIRENHPELPATAPIVATPGRPGGYLAGPLTNRYRENALTDSTAGTLVALLREAAHELGANRGQRTTSRHGRYHNQTFRDLAQTLGLTVTEDDPTRRGSSTH